MTDARCLRQTASNGSRSISAIMAEGLIVVPLYARQAPAELVAMMKDCSPALICCGDAALRDGILQAWPEAPPQYLFDESIFQRESERQREPAARRVGSGDHHLYVGNVGRGQGSHPDCGQRRPHAELHFRTPRSADGEQGRAGPRLSLSAILFCWLLDHASDLPSARAVCSL